MQEKWTQWKPLENLANEYYIKSITIAGKEFKILLGDARADSPDVCVSYTDYFISEFRSNSETFRLSTISYLDEKYGGKFYSEWTFFKIENSEYLKWLSEQSYGISDDCRLIHFCILTDDEFFDFIASDEPKVEFVVSK
jgi:hypothetical protein